MEQIMTAKNTLQDFYRSPKLYVGLPSGGVFYDEDVIDWPENNELPVLAMTPKDDLIVRNPDALLNGDAVIRLIRSCVPSIKKPEQIIAPDMELLLVAIRAASESEKAVKIEYKCTECEHEIAFKIDLGLAVQDFQAIDDLTEFELKNGLTVGVKPANYLYSINTAKQMIEQANLLGKIVDDKKQILEFLDNVDAKIGTEISDVVSSINNGGINKIHSANCEKCEAPFEVPIDFDPVSFFLTS